MYGQSRREVADKLKVALKVQRDGLPAVDARTTVEQFLTAWLAAVRPTVRHRTWLRYEQFVRLHVSPYIGRVRLVKLTAQHLQELYADRVQAGLSPTSVVQLHRVLHHALDQAAR